MKITDVAIVDPTFRAYRKCITLADTIQREHDYYQKHYSDRLSPRHTKAAQAALVRLRDLKTALRLDSTELNSHTLGEPLLRLPVAVILDQLFTGLPKPGASQHTDLEQALIDNMNMLGRQARSAAHEARLTWEIAHRAKQGWFMVFNTLTVAPHHYYQVFGPDSTAFQDYIRRIDRQLARAAYGSIRNAKGKEYHTYFAVVEEGSKHGRLHIHVLHLFEKLPPEAQDPNRALRVPYRRELNVFKAQWTEGFTSPIMVRYSPNDAFGRKGYRWPYDKRTKAAYLVRSPLHIAGYMSKYIMKSYASEKRQTNLWRIRKSQKLGQQIPTELLSMLTPQNLIAVASCNSLNLKLNNRKIPRAILQQEALRQYSSHRNRSSTANRLRTLAQMAEHIEPTPSPLISLRGSTTEQLRSSLQNTTRTQTSTSNDEDAFSEAWRALKASANTLNKKYFHKGIMQGTTSNADHLYATSIVAQ